MKDNLKKLNTIILILLIMVLFSIIIPPICKPGILKSLFATMRKKNKSGIKSDE
jgi:hypothetical protein